MGKTMPRQKKEITKNDIRELIAGFKNKADALDLFAQCKRTDLGKDIADKSVKVNVKRIMKAINLMERHSRFIRFSAAK